MSRARLAAVSLIAAPLLAGLVLAAAAPPADPKPDEQVQASIRAAVEAIGRQDEAAAAQQIETLKQEGRGRRDALLMQIALYLSESSSTEQTMAGALVLHRMEFTDHEMISIVAPRLESVTPGLNHVMKEILGSIDSGDDGDADFSAYEAWMRGRGREPGLIRYLYDRSPEHAVGSMQRLYGAGRPLRADTPRQLRAVTGRDADMAQSALAALAGDPDWWLRLYAARILRDRPELGSAAIRDKLANDTEPLVRAALAAPAPLS